MSLQPARRTRPLTNHVPAPYETDGLPAAAPAALEGRVLDTRPCVKCGEDLLGQRFDGKCAECGTAVSKSIRPPTLTGRLAMNAAPKPQRGVVGTEKLCTGCGYNLRGLPVRNDCPECGKPIITSVRPPKYGHSMMDAPVAWLKVFTAACVLFAVGGLALLASMVLWAVSNGLVGGIATAAAGVVWWVGVVLITRPRPLLPGAEIDTRREWVWSRVIARVSQAFWIVSGVLTALAATGGLTITPWFTAAAIGSAAVRGLGLAAVFVYVSNLANWAGDDTALGRTRAAIAIGPFAVFWGVVSILNGWVWFIGPSPTFFWGAGLYMLFIVLPMIHLVRTCWAVAQMGPWALQNQMHEQARLARMCARAATDLASADASREHGVVQDTAQPESVLMPGSASRPTGPAKPGDSIRPGNRRLPPKLSR